MIVHVISKPNNIWSTHDINPLYLRLPAVKACTGLSRSTIYAYIAQGHFPKQIPLGPRSSGWLASEINAWIEERLKARADTHIPSPNPKK